MTEFLYPIMAIRRDGETLVADSPTEASAFRRLNPGPSHVTRHDHVTNGVVISTWDEVSEWILRDDAGQTLLASDLPEGARIRAGWYTRRLAAARHAADRGLPIPGSGTRRRYSSGYRRFAVNIAARASEAALEDDLEAWGVGHMRSGRRRNSTLPQVWDDVAWRSDRRCWKQNRRSQWRA